MMMHLIYIFLKLNHKKDASVQKNCIEKYKNWLNSGPLHRIEWYHSLTKIQEKGRKSWQDCHCTALHVSLRSRKALFRAELGGIYPPPPDFGRSVKTIPKRVGRLCPSYISICPPPGFSNLPTALPLQYFKVNTHIEEASKITYMCIIVTKKHIPVFSRMSQTFLQE